MKKLVALLSVIISVCGCGPTIHYATFDNLARTPKHTVDVYSDASKVTREYKEIGSVTARGGDNEEVLLRKLRERAAEEGADAIIIGDSKPLRGRPNRIGAISWGGDRRAMRAIAIIYLDETNK
ncbi:MAG: hypothetical protein KAW46_09540 [candidate division Zixibacteria bacterium]|nr:hypothetical protein [candidate division Zixibacteria bacterium]